jgi:hypothetical protein
MTTLDALVLSAVAQPYCQAARDALSDCIREAGQETLADNITSNFLYHVWTTAYHATKTPDYTGLLTVWQKLNPPVLLHIRLSSMTSWVSVFNGVTVEGLCSGDWSKSSELDGWIRRDIFAIWSRADRVTRVKGENVLLELTEQQAVAIALSQEIRSSLRHNYYGILPDYLSPRIPCQYGLPATYAGIRIAVRPAT